MSMGMPHRAYQVTAGICTAAASIVPGTIVAELARPVANDVAERSLRLGHPYGVMPTRARSSVGADGEVRIDGITVLRTARAIMDGVVRIPSALFPDRVVA